MSSIIGDHWAGPARPQTSEQPALFCVPWFAGAQIPDKRLGKLFACDARKVAAVRTSHRTKGIADGKLLAGADLNLKRTGFELDDAKTGSLIPGRLLAERSLAAAMFSPEMRRTRSSAGLKTADCTGSLRLMIDVGAAYASTSRRCK